MRAVPEWVANHDDEAIPTRVKVRVFERCGGRCALTGRKLRPGDAFDYDHIIPLSVGGRHAELNLQVVLRDVHKLKTADDVALKSKIARTRAKHLGIYPKGQRIQSRGFSKRAIP